MAAFFLSLLAAALTTAAGAESVRAARLAAGLGPRAGLIVAALLAAALASGFAAWLGGYLAGQLVPAAKAMLVAFALVAAAVEIQLLRAGPAPREPTRSTGAIFLALLARQATDTARFLVLALAVATGLPGFAAAGGALGSGAVLGLAILAGPEWEARLPLAPLRWLAAALLLVSGLALGLTARFG